MLAFAKMWLKMKALIRLESLNTEFIAKGSNCRIPAESAQSAASLGHHFFQLREFRVNSKTSIDRRGIPLDKKSLNFAGLPLAR